MEELYPQQFKHVFQNFKVFLQLSTIIHFLVTRIVFLWNSHNVFVLALLNVINNDVNKKSRCNII